MRAGDPAAADHLLRGVAARLQIMARQMLRRFPNVHRWADTDDVLQNALVRLLHTLEQLRPSSAREFYNLAAIHIRRELLDLARFHGRRERAGILPPGDPLPDQPDPEDSIDLVEALTDIEKWSLFHQEVENLPEEEREVVALTFYHGWQRAQVAEFLQISERTVIRRWKSALWKIGRRFADGGDLP
jgi:RNA polymerase sigma-70 factor (ECF subfamily)